jgi:hypothetical protein
VAKKVKFIPNYPNIDGYISPPVPAKSLVPQWYKKSTRFKSGNTFSLKDEVDIKSCVPFFDALTSGYIQTTWMDIEINSDDEYAKLMFKYNGIENEDTFGLRPEDTARYMPKPFGSTKDHYIFRYPYSILTPPGYSTIFTQPFNRFDSPFIALTGIVDTDTLLHNGNYPIFIRKNFSGVVPAGTPILQMIPFKRDNWESTTDNFSSHKDYFSKLSMTIASRYGYYKNFVWKKKYYN